MEELTIEQKAKAYDEALKVAKDIRSGKAAYIPNGTTVIEAIFPELKEKTDKEMIQKLISVVHLYYGEGVDAEKDECLKWLEKQIIKPYSRTSFEYNNHTWGICARDNGIDIFYDSNLIKHIEQPQDKTALDNQNEQKQEWSKEDENEFNHVLKILNLVTEEQKIKGYNNLISSVNWLKSLKDRIQSRQSNKPQGKSALEAIKEEKVDNTNKIEPKFKVGNWYQCTKDFFGKGVTFDKNTAYYCTKEGCLQDEYGCHIAIVKDLYDNFKLWSIQDAKDGDVLLSPSTPEGDKECPFIFKEIDKNGIVRFHAALLQSEELEIADGITNVMGYANAGYHTPATIEQRDLLFQKMKDAGYEWDNDKKELEEIEQSPTDKVESKFEVGDYVVRKNGKNFNDGRNFAKIIEIDGSICRLDNGRWLYNYEIRLWTLSDAQDGDILATADNKPFIYNGLYKEANVGAHCGLNVINAFTIGNKQCNWCSNYNIRPATEKQRHLLVQKMKEAGYEWDAEKKKINKNRISMTEIEIKLEIFKAITNNSQNLCDDNKYIPPKGVANYTNEVYEILTQKNN